MKEKKSGAGGKLGRSEIIQARLDSRLKYAAELIATYERRTLSSLVETAIEQLIKNYSMQLVSNGHAREVKFEKLLEEIWHPHEIIRFIQTGFASLDLLDSGKRELWQFIYNKPFFWDYYEVTYKARTGKVIKKVWQQYHSPYSINLENLDEYWEQIQDEDSRMFIYIPDEIGNKISAPPDVKTEVIIDEEAMQVENNQAEIELLQILRENIHRLITYRKETIETPDGPKVMVVPRYPTQAEQEEMVDRLYQEKLYDNKVQ